LFDSSSNLLHPASFDLFFRPLTSYITDFRSQMPEIQSFF
jgi:hypothetical protein